MQSLGNTFSYFKIPRIGTFRPSTVAWLWRTGGGDYSPHLGRFQFFIFTAQEAGEIDGV
jgi:hypothetical protein